MVFELLRQLGENRLQLLVLLAQHIHYALILLVYVSAQLLRSLRAFP